MDFFYNGCKKVGLNIIVRNPLIMGLPCGQKQDLSTLKSHQSNPVNIESLRTSLLIPREEGEATIDNISSVFFLQAHVACLLSKLVLTGIKLWALYTQQVSTHYLKSHLPAR